MSYTDEFSLGILDDSDLYEILPPAEKKAKSLWEAPEASGTENKKLLVKVNHLGSEEVESTDEGTRVKHTLMLYLAIVQTPEFKEIEAQLKRGERIVYDGKEYTIRTIQKKPFRYPSYLKAKAIYED